MRANTSRPVLQRDEGFRTRFSSAAVNHVGVKKTRVYSTSALGETHTTTETHSQWLPKQDHQNKIIPKVIRQCRSRGNLRLPISVRRQLRHVSQNEVVEVEFALSQSEATQPGESPETVFAGLVDKAEERVV